MELNKVYQKDCIDGMKEIDNNSVDLIVTSPPYNLNVGYSDYNDNKNIDEYYIRIIDWNKLCYP